MATGYILKKKQFFKVEDTAFLSKVVLNITLPMSVLHASASLPHETSYLGIVLLGFVCSLIPFLIFFALSKSKDKQTRVFYMINSAGYNIGCFTLPLIQSFFGNFAMAITCLFDTGNAIMATGGSYALTSIMLKTNGEKMTFKDILLKFVRSVPFDAYIILLLLTIFKIRLPESLIVLSEPFANANAFLAMLMLGTMFQVDKKISFMIKTMALIIGRFILAIISSWLIYSYLPFPYEVRVVLAIVVFAPISTIAPIYTEKCGGSAALASFANFISIILGIIIMCILSILL